MNIRRCMHCSNSNYTSTINIIVQTVILRMGHTLLYMPYCTSRLKLVGNGGILLIVDFWS